MKEELNNARLKRLIQSYTGDSEIENDNDLMAKPVSLRSYDMAALFLDIEKEFSIDLNQLVPQLNIYSFNAIAMKINKLYEKE